MKKITFLTLALFILIFCVACPTTAPANPEYVGTWVRSPNITETIVVTQSSIVSTLSNGASGEAVFTVDSVDEAANHLLATCTATSGTYDAAYSLGTVYFTYSITGDQGYFSSSNAAYPPTAITGPYTKQ